MNPNQKDTIYIDIDDEITSIIDKVRSSAHKVVALVLPKRATMLQSSVNMKLLKKAAESAKKNVVLITTEAGLLPLAGAIGLHVAKNLQSKPEIPSPTMAADEVPADLLTAEETVPPEEFNADDVADVPVGKLADQDKAEVPPPTKPVKPELTPRPIPRAKSTDEDEPIALGEEELDETAATAAGALAAEASKAKPKKDKKLKVPNFERFRLRLILAAALLIILIVGWILANIILPKALVTIHTNTSSVNASLQITLDPGAKSLDPNQLIVPAHLQQTQQTQSAQVNTTGQKNVGTPATGTVSVSEYTDCTTQPQSIPAGTGISTNNLTFIMKNTASYSSKDVHTNNTGNYPNDPCVFTVSGIAVTASSPGAEGNSLPQSGAQFGVDDSQVNATASASSNFTDGTNNIVQTVAQSDIVSAEQKITSADTSSFKSSLQTALQQAGYYAVLDTFNAGSPSFSPSANVGDQTNTLTVTATTTYTMLGAAKSDLQTLLDSNIKGQINTASQTILDDGLNNASFNILSQNGQSDQLAMQATATIAPKLNLSSLKQQIKGKKAGDVKNIIGGQPGVTSVTVHYSPFWVSSTPKNTSKITIQVKKSS